MSNHRSTINVKQETHSALASKKLHKRQTFDEIIVEMMSKNTKKEA